MLSKVDQSWVDAALEGGTTLLEAMPITINEVAHGFDEPAKLKLDGTLMPADRGLISDECVCVSCRPKAPIFDELVADIVDLAYRTAQPRSDMGETVRDAALKAITHAFIKAAKNDWEHRRRHLNPDALNLAERMMKNDGSFKDRNDLVATPGLQAPIHKTPDGNAICVPWLMSGLTPLWVCYYRHAADILAERNA